MFSRFTLVLFACLMFAVSIDGQAPPAPRTDSLGDALPDGAIARLGTLRFKHTPESDPTVGRAIFSPDGKRIASYVGTLRLWDAGTGKEIPGPWSAPDKRFAAVAFSADGALMAIAGALPPPVSKDEPKTKESLGEINLWELATGKCLQTIGYKQFGLRSLAFADDGKSIAAAGIGIVRWWDIATGKEQRTWKPFNDEQEQVEVGGTKTKEFTNSDLSPDGKCLTVEVSWRFGKDVKAKPLSPTGSEIDKEIVGFNVGTGKMTWGVKGKSKATTPRFAYSHDGKRVFVTVGPGIVQVRDTLTGKLVATPPDSEFVRTTWVGGIALSSDGRRVALGCKDSQVIVWDIDSPSSSRRFTARIAQYWGNSTGCLAFSPDNKTLLVGADADLQLYDLATLKELNPWEGHRGWLDFVAFSPDGARLITGSGGINPYSQEFASWDVASWKRLQLSSLRTPPWISLTKPNPQQTVFVGNAVNRFGIFDLASGKVIGKLAVPPKQDQNAKGFFSPSGKLYVLPGKDEKGKQIQQLFAVASGKMLCELPLFLGLGTMASGRSFAFSSDDRLVALLGPQDRLIHVFETNSGKLLHALGKKSDVDQRFIDREGPGANLEFSPDGQFLAAWSPLDNVIRIWHIPTGKERLQLNYDGKAGKQAGPVGPRGGFDGNTGVHFAWSPDGRVLAVSENKIRQLVDNVAALQQSPSTQLRLWELATLGVRHEFSGHQGPVRALAFSPDGRLLASGSSDTTVLIWDVALCDAGAPSSTLDRAELDKHWQTLAEDDAGKAYVALRSLAAAHRESVARLKDKLKPATAIDVKRVEELIGQLEDNKFSVRQKAISDLGQMGEQIVPTIDKALAANPPLETRLRLQDIRTRMTGLVLQGTRLQAFRAVELLERIGNPESRQLLQDLANGAPAAMLTIQAREALARLKR